MYELLGLCLALASLLAFNTIASAGTALLWRGLAPAVNQWPAAARARLLFMLRGLPCATAFMVVLLVLLPAYAAHEPRHAVETVSFKLACLSLLSAAGLMLAGWRGMATWLTTRRLTRNWLAHAELLPDSASGLPIYRIQHPFPVLALVGIWRPRLFVADKLLAALSPAELAAALTHEAGHLAARDNSKRALLRACRDVLTLVPCGRLLDRAWDAATEEAADEFAVRQHPATALELASALVKIARLAEPEIKPTLHIMHPISASFISYEAGAVTYRVKRLLQSATPPGGQPERLSLGVTTLQWAALGAWLCLSLLVLNTPVMLAAAHHLLELFVHSLQ
jgi:Zn-dependent protease with chaperone function